MKNNQKGFINLFVVFVVVLLVGGGVYIYTQKKQPNEPLIINTLVHATTPSLISNVNTTNSITNETMTTIATSTHLTEICERTPHYSLEQIPSGWSSLIYCLRGTAIFTMAYSSDYTMESNAPAGSLYGDLVLVKGSRFEVSADPGYPYSGCNLPSSTGVSNKPITEKKSITVNGYTGILGHIQESANSPSPAIDYYYVRIPVSGAPCQMIDFVSVVSTTTNNETEFQKLISGLKFTH